MKRIALVLVMLLLLAGQARAAELLRYLYENGVPAAQAAEAVQDVCGAIAWN